MRSDLKFISTQNRISKFDHTFQTKIVSSPNSSWRAEHADAAGMDEVAESDQADDTATKPLVREGEKIGRNAPCPCGSGKKYKQCHGALS